MLLASAPVMFRRNSMLPKGSTSITLAAVTWPLSGTRTPPPLCSEMSAPP